MSCPSGFIQSTTDCFELMKYVVKVPHFYHWKCYSGRKKPQIKQEKESGKGSMILSPTGRLLVSSFCFTYWFICVIPCFFMPVTKLVHCLGFVYTALLGFHCFTVGRSGLINTHCSYWQVVKVHFLLNLLVCSTNCEKMKSQSYTKRYY